MILQTSLQKCAQNVHPILIGVKTLWEQNYLVPSAYKFKVTNFFWKRKKGKSLSISMGM